ncbi:MAG: hypothetical protein ACRDBQ_18240 [Shewanella sp.]
MKNVLPFEKLYRRRILWLVSACGKLILQGVVVERDRVSKGVTVNCGNTGESFMTKQPLTRLSGERVFYNAFYPCSTKHKARRLSATLRQASYRSRKSCVLSEQYQFKFAALTGRDKIHILATDGSPQPDKEVDVVVTLETRNELGEATEQETRILKGRKPDPRNIALSLPTMEAYGTSLKDLLSDKIPDSSTTSENFWSSDKDKE